MSDITTLTTALREAGMRVTPQRVAICELLTTSQEHPTAAMIFDELKPRFDSLSLATVYNTLDALVGLGVVNVLGHAGDDKVHYDADTEPHVNLACISCSRIIDIPSEHVTHLDSEITAASGYKLLGARVLYYGLCPDCQKKQEKAKKKQ
ncbi:MAG TPA: Fur family transcriptional regulator [Anaerolineales bacterium]|jgi:Fur family peroxide stress response transcriptional regulator|nr:Fur family transcriptional regulator [Anaerolineales bacterium]HRK88923.1 Fur family transcriptional regulator [Anaerolineales bacterium]